MQPPGVQLYMSLTSCLSPLLRCSLWPMQLVDRDPENLEGMQKDMLGSALFLTDAFPLLANCLGE